ncbi:MAG: FAD-binding oxidoreductase [Thermoleophilia bacterium]|nr:FAD-binding oxidoreductase [Thermoleophilia bacterium]
MDDRTQAASVWMATTPKTDYAFLSEDLTVDVVVVGAGIAGVSVAYRLKELGKRVVLVESGRIVEGSTGKTTAKVSSLHGLIYTTLTKNFTDEGARIYGEANEAAIDEIERLIKEHEIDCDFSRLDSYTYAQDESGTAKVRREAEIAERLGLPAGYTDEVPLPYPTYGAVKFSDQAQFHVRKYLLALAERIDGDGSFVFENTKALDISTDGDSPRLMTERGTITATDIVVTTHEPFYDPDDDYADLFTFWDYALGVLITQEAPPGEFFSTGSEPHSIRTQTTEDGDIVIIGGKSEAEATADSDDDAYDLVEVDYSDKLEIERVVYKWNTYDLATSDGASYIGQLSKNQAHVYVATGFNGWGMTNGVVAGMLLGDRLTGKENPWADFFDKFTREKYAKDSR